ncbi:hypothetical protein WA171_001357 [Blastocystis sp. BT1]
MNRIFQIAGEFLESVDQRADRSVNASNTSTSYKPRSSENRNTDDTSLSTGRDRERYSTRNPRLRKPVSSQLTVNSIKPVTYTPPVETKRVDIDVASLMATLNSDDNVSHKRCTSEQLPNGERPDAGSSTSHPTPSPQPSQLAVVPPVFEERKRGSHEWGELEGEVGLHITASVEPRDVPEESPLAVTLLENAQLDLPPISDIDVEELRHQLEEVEQELSVREEDCRLLRKSLEEKENRIDLLENKIKVMRIEIDRDKDKTETLLDEKDALIMQLQSQVESNKAEYYKLQLSIGEEKAKRERSLKQSEKEASAIQEQLKRLMEENESLRNQLLQQQSTHQQQEDRLRSQLKDQEASISSLTASLTASQKQLDESLRLDSHMDSSQQMEDRLTTTERELLKVRGEKERIVRENTQLQHAKTSIEEEMRTTIQEYEEKLVAQQQKIDSLEQQESQRQQTKENGLNLLQSQLEQLQQTVLKKQLMLDAVNSEKSALEYRLADALRDKARSESMRRSWREDDGWKDVEEGDSEEKAHPRSISRILPDGLPSIVLSKIDDCDEVSLSAIQLMLRSPTFRLIILLYFSLLNIGFVVLLLRKR